MHGFFKGMLYPAVSSGKKMILVMQGWGYFSSSKIQASEKNPNGSPRHPDQLLDRSIVVIRFCILQKSYFRKKNFNIHSPWPGCRVKPFGTISFQEPVTLIRWNSYSNFHMNPHVFMLVAWFVCHLEQKSCSRKYDKTVIGRPRVRLLVGLSVGLS